jgi:group I intron endonuclease
VNHKVYIGSSVDLDNRFAVHFSQLSRGVHGNKYLQNAWIKYGKENFVFWIIEKVNKESQLIEREQSFLNEFQEYEYGMYNICLVADRPLGVVRSEESKRKLSVTRKGKFIGTKRTEATKRKISEALKGNQNSLGYKRTAEAKRKLSEIRKGNQFALGCKRSEETRQKLSEAKKLYYASKRAGQ